MTRKPCRECAFLGTKHDLLYCYRHPNHECYRQPESMQITLYGDVLCDYQPKPNMEKVKDESADK